MAFTGLARWLDPAALQVIDKAVLTAMVAEAGVYAMEDWSGDRTVLEATSWKLAADLCRRHPELLHPELGQYGYGIVEDSLRVRANEPSSPGDVRLSRDAMIQVVVPFKERRPEVWHATHWVQWLVAEPRSFVLRLEQGAGLSSPASTPSTTPATLTWRLLALFAAASLKSTHPSRIIQIGDFDCANRWDGIDYHRAGGWWSGLASMNLNQALGPMSRSTPTGWCSVSDGHWS